MKALKLLASAALIAGVFAPAALADGRKPGSVLVYPVHRSGASMFTILCVTNTDTQPATPTSFGGSINLHFEYVNVTANPADAFKPLGCTIFDRIEFLTPADTLCVLTTCHNASAPGGQEGYVVVSAERPDTFRQKTRHNYLIGSSLVVNGAGAVYATNAIPFRAEANGDIGGVADGEIRLDGSDYESAPDVLMIDSYLAVAGSQLALINLGGTHRDCNDVYMSVWNDNERALSATLRFNCWFDQPLTSVSPLFAESFLRSIPNDPAELDINCDGFGDLETGWATIDSRGVFTTGGTRVSSSRGGFDGPMLGTITAGPLTSINGGRLLWERGEQSDGVFFRP